MEGGPTKRHQKKLDYFVDSDGWIKYLKPVGYGTRRK